MPRVSLQAVGQRRAAGLLGQAREAVISYCQETTADGTEDIRGNLGRDHSPRERLAGRKVRITVLNEPASPVTLDRALARLIADAEHLVDTLPPVPPSPAADAWSEDVVEKYRRQGFTL